MRNLNFKQVLKQSLLLIVLILSTSTIKAQLTGIKTIPTDYASIAAFVTDLNTQGVGAGGVTLNVASGYTETAPAGGFLITATGTVANPITISGIGGAPLPIITASSALTVGNLNDAIFKIQGSDYVTISNLDMRENAANTVIAAATNNMTEWGIALLYLTTTDGAQNCSIIGNTITLNRTYQNTFGIYSNSTHALGTITTSATATTATGGNSGLKIYFNTISNVNQGIIVVGPTAAVDHNDGIDIGGTSALTGNTITNYGTTGTFSGYANVSGTVNGILVRNSKNATVSYNTITSSVGGVTVGTLNGIQFPAFSFAPTGTFTQNVNNNSISLNSGLLTGAMNGINIAGTSASVTSVININSNNFYSFDHTTATASGAIVFIAQLGTHLTHSISNNTFTNIICKTTGNIDFIRNSNTLPAGGAKNVNNNAIVTAFNKTGAGGTVQLFYDFGSDPAGAVNNTNNNNFSNITVTGATIITGIQNLCGGSPTKSVSGNTLTNWIGGTSAITAIAENYGGNNTVVSNNVINNITGQGAITGINFGASNSGTNQSISTNTISNLSSTGVGGNVIALSTGASSVTALNINNNVIFGLSSTGVSGQAIGIINSATNTTSTFNNQIYNLTVSGITGPLTAGIAIIGAAGTQNIFNNKIYSITASGAITTALVVNGIAIQGGITVNTYNNLISGLTAPLANSTNAIAGIQLTSTVASSNQNVSYNSIYLNATSAGANFGTTGIYHTGSLTATTAALNLLNNIIINESAAIGTGLTVAFRRGTAASTNLASTSNKNLMFAGTLSASNLIYTDGTTPQQTMLGYQSAVLPLGHDANSFAGEAFTYGTPGSFFTSITGSSVNFLKPVAGITTQVESGAINISGITTDYAAVTRAGNAGYVGSGTNPDMGAYEFAGVSPAPVIVLNSLTPSATAQCVAAARTVNVAVTTISGTITGVSLSYSINGVAQTAITMTNISGTAWQAIIPVPTPANASIVWSVSATNSIGLNSTYSGASYSDEPLTGISGAAFASSTIVCAGSPSNLTATITIANNPVYTAPIAVSNPLVDEDLRNITISQGATVLLNNTTNYNTLVGTIGTATGTAGSYSNFTTFPATPLQASQTYDLSITVADSNDASYYTKGAGLYIDYNRNGVFTDAGEQVYISPVSSGTQVSLYTVTSTFTVPATAANGLTRMRLIANEGLVSGPTMIVGYGEFEEYTVNITSTAGITSVTWLNGATTVGTGNPLAVNPTTTTTYTANITSAGCVVSPSPTVTVTVNPLPTAPTASNSAQCGTQIPTASVASTSGLPTPTFKWYSLAVGGSVLQNSTSSTFTSNVSVTTTFYVAEVNTTTGCESSRTAVTVTVAIADGILAAINNATICIGSAVTLTATNTNPTPNQSYTYTWTGLAGSGVTSVNGNTAIVTPTLPGTYTYSLAGVNGGCNAVSSVNLTVNPFAAAITPVNVTCNAGNNGSFTLGTTTCGTSPYTYSVGGGAYGAIPTNLIAGTYSVLVKDANGYISAALPLILTQPSVTTSNPTVTNASVCQNSLNAAVSGSSTVTGFAPQNTSFGTNLSSDGTAPATFTVTVPSLPVGSVITGTTLLLTNVNSINGSWRSEIRVALSGATTLAATQISTLTSGGLISPDVSITIPNLPTTGGAVTLSLTETYDDFGVIDATFGNVQIIVSYTAPATISWWTAATGGTQIGTGSPFESVGTSVLPTTATPGVYTLYAQGQNGACPSPARTAATVTVNAPPVVNAGVDQTVCSGIAVTLVGSGASTYSWNNSVSNAVSFIPTATTTYTVTGTSAIGCTATDQVLVTVTAVPSLSATASPAATCDGNSVLTAAAAIPAPSYCQPTYGTGTVFGDYISSVQLNTLNNATVGAAAPYYTLFPTAGSTTTTLTAGSTYTITLSAGTYTENDLAAWIDFNQNGTLNDVNEKLGETDNHVAAPATTSFTFTVPLTAKNGTTKLRVRDMDALGTNYMDPCLAQSPYGETEDYTITIVGGVPLYTVAWSPATYLSSTSGLSVSASGIAANITYTATATFASGCTSANTVAVVLNPLPLVNAGVDQTICAGTAVTLNGTVAGGAWSGPVAVTNGAAFTPPVGVHTFTYSVTSAAGCTVTDAVVVTVNALPTANAGVDQTVCEGTAVTLNGTVSGGTWSGPVTVTNGAAFTPPAGVHTFTYSVTNASGCTNTDAVVVNVNALPVVNAGVDQTVCAGTAVTLSGTVAGGSWSGPVTVSDGVAFTPPAGVHTFTYSVTNASGCTNTDAVVVNVNALPVVNAGTDQTVCVGTAVTLNGTVAGGTWSGPVAVTGGVAFTPPTGIHTFTYSVTNASGCTNTDAVVVNVNALPVVNAGTDQTICIGTAVTLNGTVAGGTWSGPVAVTGGVAFTPPTGIHTFTYSVTNASGCTNTDAVVVTVNALPTVNAGADQTICAGTSIVLSGSGAASYSWDNGVTNTVAFTPAATATYTVTGTAANGCQNSDQVNVVVNSTPVATATDNGNATITSGTALTYQWINCATGAAIAGATSQTFTATANGSYAVVVGDGTCTDTSSCVVINNVSIKEIINSVVSLFPNPTRDFVTLTMTASNATVTVVDAQGKLLQSVNVVNGGTIDLSTYETGIYIFSIKTENGTSIQRISKN